MRLHCCPKSVQYQKARLFVVVHAINLQEGAAKTRIRLLKAVEDASVAARQIQSSLKRRTKRTKTPTNFLVTVGDESG
jgi:hypothetical protein